jgi:acetyltransferase
VISTTTKNLDKIFKPKSIAVIGASNREGSVGYVVFNNLIGTGYDGVVFPINPTRKSIQGVQTYPSVLNLPQVVDLAIICTPTNSVPGLVEECGKAGIKGLIIITAGFAEMGEEGQKLMKKIDSIRKQYDMRIIGPNCLGILNPKLHLNASFAKKISNHGRLAFISQSGALGTAILDWAIERDIGFNFFASIGSMVDVTFGDLLDYFGADPETQSIIIYMESIKDPRTFMSAARGFAMNKPVIIVKSGRGEEGAKAAASHTGALAGADDIYDAALRRTGALRVSEVSDLFNISETLALQPTPKGNRLVIITNAGGPGVMATDALTLGGGRLARLSDETMKALNACLPPFWSRSNPVDVLGDATAERYANALDICLKDPSIDGALIILTPQAMTDSDNIARALVEKAKTQTKPILATWMGGELVRKGREILGEGKIPNYDTPEEAVNAFLYMYKYQNNITMLYETPEILPVEAKVPVDTFKKQFKEIFNSGRKVLSEREAKLVFDAYDIPCSVPYLAKSPDEAVSLAEKIGYPVVMKIESEDISHKSDANCVLLNISNADKVKESFKTIMDNAKKYKANARLDGVTVQKMVTTKGHEVILGCKKDPLFGSVILFGMGGIAVEVIKDSAIGIPPLNQTLARRMIESTRVFKLLKKGFRNLPPADLKKVEAAVINFSQLVVDFPEIAEIDINPMICTQDGAIALDGRIILDEHYYNEQEKNIRPYEYPHLIISPYPRHYMKQINVNKKDVLLRPIRPEDDAIWLEMFNNFSEESKRFRFFHIVKEMPKEKRIRYLFNDYDREIAIVATIKENNVEKMLGVARMTGDADGETAEFSIILLDDWQSVGLGEEMYDHIIAIAKQKGWKKMVAQVMVDNIKMVNLFKKKGLPYVKDPDEPMYHFTADLTK